MAAKPVKESPPSQTLKYQTWVFKVFIHCEACKKKVKKVLHAIDGVYKTEIDSQQHKVTVTGNVDSETLIKKLLRSGKYAQLWPEKPQKKDNKSAKSKGGDKENHGNKNNDNEPIADYQQKDVAGDEELEKEDSEGDEAGGTSGGGVGGSDEAGKKKKKKKKKNKGQNVGTPDIGGQERIGEAPPSTGSPVNGPSLAASMASMNLNHPVQDIYHYPQMYYSPSSVPPPQIHGLTYNTAYPSFSNPYYAAPMHAAYATYSHLPPPPPPPNPIRHYSDDDDNGRCSIM